MRSADLRRIADMLSQEHRVSIVPDTSWKSDIKNRVIYYDQAAVYQLPDDHVLGILLHEIGHIRFTTEVPKDIQGNNPELRHEILNVLEDIRIEERISRAYPNAREIMDMTRSEAFDMLIGILPQHNASLHEKSLLYASARFYNRGFAKPTNDYEVIGELIKDVMVKNKNDIFNAIITRDLNPIAEEIQKLLENKAGKMNDSQRQQLAQKHASKMIGGYTQVPSKNGKGRGTRQYTRGQGMTDVQKAIQDKLREKYLQQGGGSGRSDLIGALNGDLYPVVEILEESHLVGKRLDSILKRNNTNEYAGRFRSGKLQARRLFRVRSQKDTRPFGRLIVKSNKSYAFTLLCDVSGSMFDEGMPGQSTASVAGSSMIMVAEALKKAKIKRASYAFAGQAVKYGNMDLKDHSLSALESTIRRAGGGTDIANGIKAGIAELEATDAEKKIIVFFTDGEDRIGAIAEMVKLAEKKGIEVMGVFYSHFGSTPRTTQELKKGNWHVVKRGERALVPKIFLDILKRTVKESR